jgi:hypothetical protein
LVTQLNALQSWCDRCGRETPLTCTGLLTPIPRCSHSWAGHYTDPFSQAVRRNKIERERERRAFYITTLSVAKFVVMSSEVAECNACMGIDGIC